MNKTKRSHQEDLIQYILFFEEDDFKINPSTRHIYYSALVLSEGQEKADQTLKAAKDLNET